MADELKDQDTPDTGEPNASPPEKTYTAEEYNALQVQLQQATPPSRHRRAHASHSWKQILPRRSWTLRYRWHC